MAKQKAKNNSLLDELDNDDLLNTSVEDTLENFVEEQESKEPEIEEEEELDDIAIRKANVEALRKEMLAARQRNGADTVKDSLNKKYAVPDNFILLNKDDLPSKGMFYYPETELYIRSANVSEIRNWSMWESDEITAVDNKLNFILKNCLLLKDPVNDVKWSDLKDMDRLYVVLAIRDLTFPMGTNDLMISVGQNKKVPVRKESVDFIDLPESLLNKYNEHKRCFCIETPEKKVMDFYIPSLGNTEWIKNYIIEKSRAQEPYDVQFCSKVPYLLAPTVHLTEKIFNKLYDDFNNMSIFEASALSEFTSIITSAINPTFTFEDEAGGKQTVPFSFHGGFRSLFVIQNIF